ncbi:MAG: phosphotriesterase family protein [Paraclostridium sp.]|uniref:phosphotriesterase family protein n=1 Tax=Paraclostridium sp. TaxID=2023273 RepID=UPI003EE75215
MKIIDGYTLCHEHMYIDLSKVKQNEDCRLDCKNETIREIKKLYESGVRNIVEVTNMGIGRDINYIKDIEKESNINFILSTGFYKEPFLPDIVSEKSEKTLAKLMLKELTQGIEDTNYKASLIGEIGTSKDFMTELEKKVFVAASIAHNETNCPITTHTTLGSYGIEQVNLFKEYNVNLSKVVIGHVDLSGNIDYILRLLNEGVYVEFDTIGKINYLPDEKRVDMLVEISKRGLIDQVVMSVDITRKSHLKYKGGIGYNYLFETFIPKLREAGISENNIDKMLKENPKNLFK